MKRVVLLVAALGALVACGDDEPSAEPPATVIIVGDSITVGSFDAIERELAAAGVPDVQIDAAVGRRIAVGDGDVQPLNGVATVEGLLAFGASADTWVIALGTNDVGQYDETGEFLATAQLLALIPESARLVWVDTCLPGRQEQSDRFNATMSAQVAARDDADVATWSDVCATEGLLQSDQIHPTNAGEDAFAALIREAVAG
jgi:lysophospholipase L1-like esterase